MKVRSYILRDNVLDYRRGQPVLVLHFYKVSIDILEEARWVHSAMSLSTQSCTILESLISSTKILVINDWWSQNTV